MSISSLFEIGRRSLSGYQTAIDTTSNNIANSNNEGYTRRRVDLNNLTTINGFAGFGSGVDASSLSRMREKFAEYSLWRENHNLGKYEKTETLLTQIESIFGDDSDGSLQNVLSEFWNSWNDLATEPESESYRTLVKNKGQLLANTFRSTHTRVVKLQRQLDPELYESVAMINKMSEQLLEINQQLRLGNSPDLMDRRDQLITDLSHIINIDVKEKDNGEVSILFGGHILISENKANALEVNIDRTNNLHAATITFKDSDFEPDIDGGSLSGLLNVFNENIPNYLDQLDTLANSISEQVNSAHSAGYNLAGTTGINFFNSGSSGAANLQMNQAVINDPTLIATRGATEGVGANSVAESIFNLQFDTFVANETPADFYISLVTEIGSEIDDASFLRYSQELITQQLQNQRDEISGVSLDEEMTKLVQYEQAYQAAAKIIQTVDEMINTVLELA
ncbi:MAG: flagellar hook-associated protein FlgK [Calditrichaeota bacterium]|nr:MAG: flagellar hook-associated protein FlgK [Calditrichota bacterium]MBL1204039.1 flagellar hook-associated protein FlgK [Calditrichota bacterium]NOG43870.1 flagellar hook-associated protein FlgK [Calditrichota bacterium]